MIIFLKNKTQIVGGLREKRILQIELFCPAPCRGLSWNNWAKSNPKLILLFHEDGMMVSCEKRYRLRSNIFMVLALEGIKQKALNTFGVDRAFIV
jgi:hypothetical protein